MCAEWYWVSLLSMKISGSPPHARGRRADVRTFSPRSDITPACAGKTPAHLVCATITTDHPRMCGEDIRTPNVAYDKLRSPPHARGRLVFHRWRVFL